MTRTVAAAKSPKTRITPALPFCFPGHPARARRTKTDQGSVHSSSSPSATTDSPAPSTGPVSVSSVAPVPLSLALQSDNRYRAAMVGIRTIRIKVRTGVPSLGSVGHGADAISFEQIPAPTDALTPLCTPSPAETTCPVTASESGASLLRHTSLSETIRPDTANERETLPSCDSCTEKSADAPQRIGGVSAREVCASLPASPLDTNPVGAESRDNPSPGSDIPDIRSLSPGGIPLPGSPQPSGSEPARSPPRLAGAANFDNFLAGTTKSLTSAANIKRAERPDGMVNIRSGLMPLPLVYTLCPLGTSCQSPDRCMFSHQDRSLLFPVSASGRAVCMLFLKGGFCPSGGISCRLGVHPCVELSRRNRCFALDCGHGHTLRVTPSGELINAPRYGEVAGSLPPVNSVSKLFGDTYKPRVYDPKLGGTRLVLGPRSDNDYMAYRNISVMPTVDEILGRPDIYLPPKGTPKSHEEVLDVEFRHMRESELGDAREAVTHALFSLASGRITRFGGVGDFGHGIYSEVNVDGIDHSEGKRHQVNVDFSFLCLSPRKRGEENRFQDGGLIALGILDKPVGAAEYLPRVIFLRTAGRWYDRDGNGRVSQTAHVSGCLFVKETIDEDFEFFLNQTRGKKPTMQVLVDIPGIVVGPIYKGLNILQQMATISLPFAESAFAGKGLIYEIPKYLQGTPFDLASLGLPGTSIDIPEGTASQSFTRRLKAMLASQKTLYPAQQDAIVQSLTKGLSLIQGPPGTGKSFTSKTLVRALAINRRSNIIDPPPILVTAQTNHALDQFLTELGKEGLKVARLGRPFGEDEAPNPDHYAWSNERLANRAPGKWAASNNFTAAANSLDEILGLLETGRLRYTTLKPFLSTTARQFLTAFSSEAIFARWSRMDDLTEEADLPEKLQAIIPRGFRKGGFVAPSLTPLTMGADRPLGILREDTEIWGMTSSERVELMSYWKSQMGVGIIQQTVSAVKQLRIATEENKSMDFEIMAKKIRQYKTDVVGCTMTGVATMYEVLRLLGIEVVVVEEAGEVVEHKTLTAFLPTVQHMVMIGDHMQLKPFCRNTKMVGKPYQLDVSLFERLASKGNDGSLPRFSLVQLDVQRRMRPQIADFVRALSIYPVLQDGPNVAQYADVPGMGGRNVLWINHSEPEAFSVRGDMSYSNSHEAGMIAEHCALLLRTGEYNIGDIVVIAPYRAQLKEIGLAFRELGLIQVSLSPKDQERVSPSGSSTPVRRGEIETSDEVLGVRGVVSANLGDLVRVVTVDEYQGDEADVVIVSCVRSNAQGSIGFTDILNRTCVLLTRARRGLYIYGNAETLSHQSQMWNTIITHCSTHGYLTIGIEVGSCPRHPTEPVLAKKPSDFKKPTDRCLVPCGVELPCGHVCDLPCHRPALHGLPGYSCKEPCQRDADCGHQCAEPCGRLCKCNYSNSVPLQCGHVLQKQCGSGASASCNSICGFLMECGHICQKECGSWCCRERIHDCEEPCSRVSSCGHQCQEICHPGACPNVCATCAERRSLARAILKNYDNRLSQLENHYNIVIRGHETSEERERIAQGLDFTTHEAFEKNLNVLRGRVTEFDSFQDKFDEISALSIDLSKTHVHNWKLDKLVAIKNKLHRMLISDWQYLAEVIDAKGAHNRRMKNFALAVNSVIDHIRTD